MKELIILIILFLSSSGTVGQFIEENNVDPNSYQGKALIQLFDDRNLEEIKSNQPVSNIKPVVNVSKDDVLERVVGQYIEYDQTVLPVDQLIVSSAFGPRQKASKDFAYDFHMGIDLVGEIGDPVYSIADGEVFRVFHEGESHNPYPNGGNVVIIRHRTDIPFRLHEKDFSVYYSIYMHVDESLVVNTKENGQYPKVLKGQQIATVGSSGTTDFSHLHFEVRIGTTCSHSFQLNNPNSSCSNTWTSPKDPHVNPFLFLPYSNDARFGYEFKNNRITISLDRRELDFNHFEARGERGNVIVDFDNRDGLVLGNIDQNVFDGYQVLPSKFNKDSDKYEIGFEFDDMNEYSEFILTDIWGEGIKVKR
jgi:murein DD-endopeptidase MepM/ murein hydrolase activator NlpD